MTDAIDKNENWDNNNNETMKERRGQFLTVICVLSFIWIGYNLIATFMMYMGGPEALQGSLQDLEKIANSSDSGDAPSFVQTTLEASMLVIEKTMENFTAIHISNMVALLIGGLGVYMMFNLKRMTA